MSSTISAKVIENKQSFTKQQLDRAERVLRLQLKADIELIN